MSLKTKLASLGIALLCFGYFASYIPFSMLSKMLTSGTFEERFTGLQIMPILGLGTLLATLTFISCIGWWKYCTHSKILGVSIPRPQWFTFISGVCTAGQIITTVLAYTFEGISIVFAMLLMRGGVLIIAPVVDMIVKKRKRKIYWPSCVAAILSLAAVLLAFNSKAGTAMTVAASVNIGLYLFGYFFRLYIMSNRAKSDDKDERRRYFAEEQMVANPVLLIGLIIAALIGRSLGTESVLNEIWKGFTIMPNQSYFWIIFFTGIFSYGTGLFGSLIFLDKRENTFTVPANRASSILSGVIATYLLAIFYGQKYPGADQLIGASLIIVAIFFLMYRTIIEKKKNSVKVAQSAQTLKKASHGVTVRMDAVPETE